MFDNIQWLAPVPVMLCDPLGPHWTRGYPLLSAPDSVLCHSKDKKSDRNLSISAPWFYNERSHQNRSNNNHKPQPGTTVIHVNLSSSIEHFQTWCSDSRNCIILYTRRTENEGAHLQSDPYHLRLRDQKHFSLQQIWFTIKLPKSEGKIIINVCVRY